MDLWRDYSWDYREVEEQIPLARGRPLRSGELLQDTGPLLDSPPKVGLPIQAEGAQARERHETEGGRSSSLRQLAYALSPSAAGGEAVLGLSLLHLQALF